MAVTPAPQKLGDIRLKAEACLPENSATEGQLYFQALTTPASREGHEIVGLSGMLRVRGSNLPTLDQIYELSINPAKYLVEILAAPNAHAKIIGGAILGQPDALVGLSI